MNQLVVKKMNQMPKKKKKGFTLIELIIVIAIIAILAAIALPKFGQIRENGNVKADIATAKNIQTAVSTAIANGEITLDSNGDNSSITLSSVIDGTIPKVKAASGGHRGGDFTVTVDNNVVIVEAGGIQVLPTPSSPYNLS